MTDGSIVRDHYCIASVADLSRAGIAITSRFTAKKEYLVNGSSPEEWVDEDPKQDNKQKLLAHTRYCVTVDGIEFFAKPRYINYPKAKYVNSVYMQREFTNVIIFGTKEGMNRVATYLNTPLDNVKHMETLSAEYPDVFNP